VWGDELGLGAGKTQTITWDHGTARSEAAGLRLWVHEVFKQDETRTGRMRWIC